MPNWRKVITSGSEASLASVTTGRITTTSITGSLVSGSIRGEEYTPSYTSVSNILTLSGQKCTYQRINNVVSVSGIALFTATTTNVNASFRLTLPFTSNFTSYTDCTGNSIGLPNLIGVVTGDTTNDQALVTTRIGATVSTTSSFNFQYKIK